MSEPSTIDPLISNNSPFKKPFLHALRVLISSVVLALWCIVMVVVNLFWRVLRIPKLEKSYFIFHTGCCLIFNLKLKVKGRCSTSRPTLFLSNHISYLDIFVLGSCVPAFFIAKSEVASWPVLGWLAKIQNTLFFERKSKRVRQQMAIMSEHFNNDGNLILFPEGTSTDGEHVKPFKSSLLQSVEDLDKAVLIQPVTLVYTRYKGEAMDRATRDQYAWYDTMPFTAHFFTAMGLAKAEVELVFHEPVKLSDFETRKECAQYCFEQVENGLHSALNRSEK